MPPAFFFRPAPVRFGSWLILGALACWGLAAFLWWYPRVAAALVAGGLVFAGLTLLGLGAVLWRAEAAARRSGSVPPPSGAPPVRDAEARWREEEPGPRPQ